MQYVDEVARPPHFPQQGRALQDFHLVVRDVVLRRSCSSLRKISHAESALDSGSGPIISFARGLANKKSSRLSSPSTAARLAIILSDGCRLRGFKMANVRSRGLGPFCDFLLRESELPAAPA